MSRERQLLVVQLLATLAIIAFVPGNAVKAISLLFVWALTFRRLSAREAIFYVVVCCFFTFMDSQTVAQGSFVFNYPDIWGLPYFEPLMWGFYLLHTRRMIGGPVSERPKWWAWLLPVAFAAAFPLFSNHTMLLAATGTVLVVSLACFHTRYDLMYTGYLIMLGAMVEFTGVYSGNWHYPVEPPLGVPFWFATMWGGIGLFFYRFASPLLVTPATEAAGTMQVPSTS